MLFTISICSDDNITVELHEMTEKEIEKFITDLQEQVYLLSNYDSSDGSIINKDNREGVDE